METKVSCHPTSDVSACKFHIVALKMIGLEGVVLQSHENILGMLSDLFLSVQLDYSW